MKEQYSELIRYLEDIKNLLTVGILNSKIATNDEICKILNISPGQLSKNLNPKKYKSKNKIKKNGRENTK